MISLFIVLAITSASGYVPVVPPQKRPHPLPAKDGGGFAGSRRGFLPALLLPAAMCVAPGLARAADRSPTNAAVTQSDLGVAVRKSVVRGAQAFDRLDGGWERFSDRFQLGSERAKRDARPAERVLPERARMDPVVCLGLLDGADMVFVSLVPSLSERDLGARLGETYRSYRRSFERSAGVNFSDDTAGELLPAQYNFLSYVHFRTYVDILIEKQVDFRPFYRTFQARLGAYVLAATTPDRDPPAKGTNPAALRAALSAGLLAADTALSRLRRAGLLLAWDVAGTSDTAVDDWAEGGADLVLSVALDGDASIGAQCLIQEQGYRLYPNFASAVVGAAVGRALVGSGCEFTAEDYYMDTSYSSDPDKFEVKQVLVNLVIKGA